MRHERQVDPFKGYPPPRLPLGVKVTLWILAAAMLAVFAAAWLWG